ncbi:unnamed protein product [Ceutorhynchus assimilis]|uniref:C-type lectin domain-containing protein n=1 Tax=Ceutorhynchus assimilis TaxID=467358 RepID=A0A9N9MLQ3_9CUCU|nr:unnamed protein product [Ceutorhynchus assimilis]
MMIFKISVLCAIAAVSFAHGMMIRRPWPINGQMLLGRRYLTTTETDEETATEQSYEKESDRYVQKQQNVEKIFILSDNKLNWTEAREACLESGRMLANPSTPEQIMQLNSYIWDNDLSPPDVYSGYWLGGHREDDSGPFKWETGEEVEEGRYKTGWMLGEPNYDGENCIELKSDLGTLGFNNYYCQLVKRYICEEIVSQEHAKNLQETSNNEVHEEENKNLVELIYATMQISDSDEFGTILMTPRNDISDEVDTESPSDFEQFGTILMTPRNDISDEVDTESQSDFEQFGTILMTPKKDFSGEVDTESPSAYETSDYDQFGTMLMGPRKVIISETQSTLGFETLDNDQFDTIVVVPKNMISDEIDPLTSDEFGTILIAPENVISDEVETKPPMTLYDIIRAFEKDQRAVETLDSDTVGAEIERLANNNSDASISRDIMENRVVDAPNESGLIELISGNDIVAKTELPIDTIRLDDPFSLRREAVDSDIVAKTELPFDSMRLDDPFSLRREDLDDDIVAKTELPFDTMKLDDPFSPSDPDVMILGRFEDVQPETSDNQLGDIETERTVSFPMVYDNPGYRFQENLGPIDDYYGDLQDFDNWGIDNDEFEQE